MAKVEIRQMGGLAEVIVDGLSIANSITAYSIHQKAGKCPNIEFVMCGRDNKYMFDEANIQYKFHPETLQEAAMILQKELLKKGDWYDGFVASIGSSLQESGVYDPDVEDMARRVLNRIIGLEEQDGDN